MNAFNVYNYQNKIEPTMACDIPVTYVTNSRISHNMIFMVQLLGHFIKTETLFAPCVQEEMKQTILTKQRYKEQQPPWSTQNSFF